MHNPPTSPRVSVIIIVFNGDRYLAEAVDSVLAQTFLDWELLIADDGSTDRSLEIARDYAARYPDRIVSIAHPDAGNHGMSATRNLGIAAARAALIGFLDCDDVWQPAKLAEQVEVMDAHPDVQMIYGRTLIWHSWHTGVSADDYYYDLGVSPDDVIDPPRLLAVLLENKSQTPTTCNALMRTGLVGDVAGFENRFRNMFEDQVFFAKVLLTAPTYVSSKSWALYRQHPASFSARATDDGVVDRAHLKFLVWYFGYVLRTAPTNLATLAQIFRLGLWQCWTLLRPRRPTWLERL